MEQIIHTARLLIIWPIKLYQYLLSPYLGSCCRFYPTCSNYALEAVQRYGVFKGTWLAIKRIARCHPWSPGGYNPASSIHSDFN
jgi:putative membrane protein insertion efficiency factor